MRADAPPPSIHTDPRATSTLRAASAFPVLPQKHCGFCSIRPVPRRSATALPPLFTHAVPCRGRQFLPPVSAARHRMKFSAGLLLGNRRPRMSRPQASATGRSFATARFRPGQALPLAGVRTCTCKHPPVTFRPPDRRAAAPPMTGASAVGHCGRNMAAPCSAASLARPPILIRIDKNFRIFLRNCLSYTSRKGIR